MTVGGKQSVPAGSWWPTREKVKDETEWTNERAILDLSINFVVLLK